MCSQRQLRRNRLPFHVKCFPLTFVSSLRRVCGDASRSRLRGQGDAFTPLGGGPQGSGCGVASPPPGKAVPRLTAACACGGGDLAPPSGVAGAPAVALHPQPRRAGLPASLPPVQASEGRCSQASLQGHVCVISGEETEVTGGAWGRGEGTGPGRACQACGFLGGSLSVTRFVCAEAGP